MLLSELKADPDMEFVPRTVIIGGKVEISELSVS